nr:hypothetical protein [Corynebacterium lactis]
MSVVPAKLRVTKAGDAAQRADFSKVVDAGAGSGETGTSEAGGREIEFVDQRASVVLYVADSDVEPTRECVETIEAIAEATGRVAVGLIGAGEFGPSWRRAVPGQIPMGALDSKMGRTLVLLADGPPRALPHTASLRRRKAQQAQLVAERARRAEAAGRGHGQARASLDRALDEVLGRLALTEARQSTQLRAEATGAAREVADAAERLGLGEIRFEVPVPSPSERPNVLMEGVLSVMVVAAAMGVARLLATPMSWVGVTGLGAQVAMGAVGLVFAAVAIAASLRRNAKQRRIRWVAAYLSRLRRGWLRQLDGALAQRADSGRGSWRIAQLSENKV